MQRTIVRILKYLEENKNLLVVLMQDLHNLSISGL